VSFVTCSAPLPTGSTAAALPHAGTDVVGVVEPPAVRHAAPNELQRLGVDAVPVNDSVRSVGPVATTCVLTTLRRTVAAEPNPANATARITEKTPMRTDAE
jgi:hypothetical protein